jgi:hypothetical protein
MLNDATVGHPTTRGDVIAALDEVVNLYERGNDEQALHLIDVLYDGVLAYLEVDTVECTMITRGLSQIANQIEAGQNDVDDFVRELSNSLKTEVWS